MTYFQRIGLAMLVSSATAANSWASSPWLPGPGQLTVIETYSSDTFTHYFQGSHPNTLPAPYDQFTFTTDIEYGLRRNLTLDVEAGHTKTFFRGSSLGGLSDSLVGLRMRAYTGERFVVTLRAAGIIAGTYDLTKIANFSPGDKASGALGSAILGYSLPHNFFTFSETGYRVRASPVPQDFFGNAGVGYFVKGLTFTTDYQTSRSINGVDISGTAPKFNPPYFTALEFPATKKIFGAIDSGINFSPKAGLILGFTSSTILHGRNVGKKQVFAFSVGFTLPGRGR
jgi:hypothetical protein